jgi:hypothetical protein
MLMGQFSECPLMCAIGVQKSMDMFRSFIGDYCLRAQFRKTECALTHIDFKGK